MLDRLMYLKVSCYGGCQVTLALETGLEISLATAHEDTVSHPDPDPISPASVPAKLRACQFAAIKDRSVHASARS